MSVCVGVRPPLRHVLVVELGHTDSMGAVCGMHLRPRRVLAAGATLRKAVDSARPLVPSPAAIFAP